jgi:outer membrane protein
MKRLFAIFLVTVLMGAGVEAKEITLEEATQLALSRNNVLRAQQQAVREAKWSRYSSWGNYLPQVDLITSLTRLDKTSLARANGPAEFFKELGIEFTKRPRDAWTSNLRISQQLFTGGTNYYTLRAAGQRHSASKYELDATRNRVLFDVEQAYFGLLNAEANLDVWKQTVQSSKLNLEKAQLRFKIGQGNKADLLRWEFQAARDEEGLITARKNRDLARLALSRAIGVDESFDAAPGTWKVTYPNKTDSSRWNDIIRILTERAYSSSPELLSRDYTQRASKSAYRASYGYFMPRVDFVFDKEWETDNDIRLDGIQTWSASIVFTIPLFSGFQDYSLIKQSSAQYQQAARQYDDYRLQFREEVASAVLTLKETISRAEATDRQVDQADENFSIVKKRRELGAATNIDLVDAGVIVRQAALSQNSARFDFYLARAYLARLVNLEYDELDRIILDNL